PGRFVGNQTVRSGEGEGVERQEAHEAGVGLGQAFAREGRDGADERERQNQGLAPDRAFCGVEKIQPGEVKVPRMNVRRCCAGETAVKKAAQKTAFRPRPSAMSGSTTMSPRPKTTVMSRSLISVRCSKSGVLVSRATARVA